MISHYKTVSIVYGGNARIYAEKLNDRIVDLSETDRYPIRSRIIMENILTQELLSEVINLFKQSELCVAFLTADDIVETGSKKFRLRQNVIFELGMALIQLGRERCIILSDFDIKNNLFELPSDMSSLEIRYFCPTDIETVIDDIINKILRESRVSIISGARSDVIPQYDYLLLRADYYVDYEKLFLNDLFFVNESNSIFYKGVLNFWFEECKSFKYFDEKCIYLIERLCFLPMLGSSNELMEFMKNTSSLIDNYKLLDIKYYKDVDILNFTSLVVHSVIQYTQIKMNNIKETCYGYEKLLKEMTLVVVPDKCNPILKLVYYDYMGLSQLKLYNEKKQEKYVVNAIDSFKEAIKYVGLVDMSMQIWAGFLYYNLARAYEIIDDVKNAETAFRKAVSIRERWIKLSSFNIRIRKALSSEYFISKMSYLKMCEEHSLMSKSEVRQEYGKMEMEIASYGDVEEGVDPLVKIRNELSMRINAIKE